MEQFAPPRAGAVSATRVLVRIWRWKMVVPLPRPPWSLGDTVIGAAVTGTASTASTLIGS